MRIVPMALVVMSVTITALHAEPVKPWPAKDCADLANTLSKSLEIPVRQAVGSTTTHMEHGPPGSGCLMSGKTSGLNRSFADGITALTTAMEGWKQDPDMAADGPGSTVQGFVRDNRHVVVSVENNPPPGLCKDDAIYECKVPRKRWTWKLDVTAYEQ